MIHTKDDQAIEYDVLMLALGARPAAHYTHALTIDEPIAWTRVGLRARPRDAGRGGRLYLKSLAFVSPGRMAWPLPLYELALMRRRARV